MKIQRSGLIALILVVPAAFGSMESGDSAMATGNFEGAASAYEAVAQETREPDAFIKAARAYLAIGDIERGDRIAKRGLRRVKTYSQKFDLMATRIRFATLEDFPAGLRRARAIFADARRTKYEDEHAELHLAIGLAYLKAQDIEEAIPLLEKSLQADDQRWQQEASAALKKSQLIQGVLAASGEASQFAFSDSINRGEMASLITDWLDLAAYVTVENTANRSENSDQGLNDYSDSSYKEAILSVHRAGLRSLRIRNGKFDADTAITREALALVVEDILHLKSNISRTQFIGTASPYADVKNSGTAFNAIMTSVSRGLIQTDSDGNFHPDEVVSGAEVIATLQKLKAVLQS